MQKKPPAKRGRPHKTGDILMWSPRGGTWISENAVLCPENDLAANFEPKNGSRGSGQDPGAVGQVVHGVRGDIPTLATPTTPSFALIDPVGLTEGEVKDLKEHLELGKIN